MINSAAGTSDKISDGERAECRWFRTRWEPGVGGIGTIGMAGGYQTGSDVFEVRGKVVRRGRDITLRMAVAALPLAWSSGAACASGWVKAPFRGEETRTVQGCAERFTAESYVCAYVRCEPTGELALYLAAPGPDFLDRTEIDIDDTRFVVTMHSAPMSNLPYVKRAVEMPAGLLEALKNGRRIRFTNSGFAKGYDEIRLTNAGRAIGQVENICRRESRR